jgi:hypothetical protein
MKNFENPYIGKEELGKINGWNYFYEQPGGVDVEEASQSNHAVYAGKYRRSYQDIFLDKKEINLWHGVYCRNIRLNHAMKVKVNDAYQRLFQKIIEDNKKILGVKFRGADYSAIKPRGDYIQPTIEQMILETKKVMSACNCEYIYLAVDEEKAKNAFVDCFGDKVLIYECKLLADYSKYDGMSMAQISALSGRYQSVNLILY